jgi:hypothetical protein
VGIAEESSGQEQLVADHELDGLGQGDVETSHPAHEGPERLAHGLRLIPRLHAQHISAELDAWLGDLDLNERYGPAVTRPNGSGGQPLGRHLLVGVDQDVLTRDAIGDPVTEPGAHGGVMCGETDGQATGLAMVSGHRVIDVVHVEDLVAVGQSGGTSLVHQEPFYLPDRRWVVPAVGLLTALERFLLDLQPDDAH